MILLLVRSVTINILSVLSSKHIHASLLRCVLSAPISTFFDVRTVGEILNRFAKDMEVVDSLVPDFMVQVWDRNDSSFCILLV